MRKYFKQMDRLTVQDGILYSLFYDDTGRVQFNLCCLPKHLWKEVLYRLHNSTLARHVGFLNKILFLGIYRTLT